MKGSNSWKFNRGSRMYPRAMQTKILELHRLLYCWSHKLQVKPKLELISSTAQLELSFSKSNLNRLIEFMSLQLSRLKDTPLLK